MGDETANPGELADNLKHPFTSIEAYLRSVFDDMFEGIQFIDYDFRYLYLNRSAAAHGRASREELIGQKMSDAYPCIERTDVFKLIQCCMSERVPQQMINRFTYPDGRVAWFDLRISPAPTGVLILSVDITDLKCAEEKLKHSEQNLAATLACMTEGVITADTIGRILSINPAAATLTGWSQRDALGCPLEQVVRSVSSPSTSTDTLSHYVNPVLKQEAGTCSINHMILEARNAVQTPVAVSIAPLGDGVGTTRGVILVLRDIRKERELTEMLNQSQKMEAIGRLAGGIAHDFNNILMVISGYSEMAMRRESSDSVLREQLEEISEAANRAASLTRQLLAFSRKQVLQPVVLDLNVVVNRMDNLLRRLLGEDINLITKLQVGLDPVWFDPGQIEQIIMNLAINSRDAMPKGGKLILETANTDLDESYARSHPDARPGPHIMLAVSDTGTGMDAATRARLFEPFFTTKERGRGTGLGLATVYGIVKQSGGNIWVYSELGRGTTFKIYLPRANEAAAGPVTKVKTNKESHPRGTETILVVEDQEAVRNLVKSVLESSGYNVLTAGDANDAIRICVEYDKVIHLLLTDVVLPEVGGKEMAEKIVSIRPAIRVVYMSGYTDNAIVHQGILDPGTSFIEKPVTPDTLLQKIRGFLS